MPTGRHTKRAKTQGLIAAPPTAFREDGSLDLNAVGALANHLKEQGVMAPGFLKPAGMPERVDGCAAVP